MRSLNCVLFLILAVESRTDFERRVERESLRRISRFRRNISLTKIAVTSKRKKLPILKNHERKLLRALREDKKPPDPLFMANATKLLEWSSIVRDALPQNYSNFSTSTEIDIFCGFNQCFATAEEPPSEQNVLAARNRFDLDDAEGFILVANNPSLNIITDQICPPPNYRVFRFNDCKSLWPPASPADIVVLRAQGGSETSYSGIYPTNQSLVCSQHFGNMNFQTLLLGRNHALNATRETHPLYLEEVWRLPRQRNQRLMTFSSGTSLLLYLRKTFPKKPIIALGFTFHREYPCKIRKPSDCPLFTHNYPLERLFVSTLPLLTLLQTTSEIKRFLALQLIKPETLGGWRPLNATKIGYHTSPLHCPTSLLF